MQIYEREHNVFIIRNIGKSFEKIGTFEAKDFKLKDIRGIVSNENELKYYDKHTNKPNISFGDTLTWTGEWFGLFYDDVSKTGLFGADFFGFGQIFYGICQQGDERILVVGDSFRGVSQVLKQLSSSVGINWHIATPHLISITNIFSTRCSFETFSEDINVLNEDEILLFGRRGISIIKKPVPDYLSSLSYAELLQKGIEKAAKMIKVAAQSGRVNELSLSGGKDSRALLGLILASGERNISVYTAPSAGVAAGASREILDQDFSLACRLTEYFGLSWNTNTEFNEYRISFDEAVNTWQDLRGNSTFDFRPKYSQVIDKQEVRFTGIGGELFRSYIGIGYKDGFPQWWANAGKNKSSIRQDLASLFRVLCSDLFISPSLYKKSLDAFVDAMDFGYGDDVIQQLDINYSKYRSRCHSGVAHTHYAEGALLSYPLCLPEFVYASKQLSRHDQEQGRTLFDILEYTLPDLNTLEYASPPWDQSLKTKGSKNWGDITGGKQADNYQYLVKARSKQIEQRNVKSFDFDIACSQRLIQNMDKLQQFALDHQLYFFDGIIQRVVRAHQKSAQHLYSMVSKTETLLDVIEDKKIKLNLSEFDLHSINFIDKSAISPSYKKFNLFTENQGQLARFSEVCQEIDMSDFKLKGEIDTSQKCIHAIFSNIKAGCEIACYLYENGIKINQIWYQPEHHLTFNVPSLDLTKRYRLTAFYKWKNEPLAQKTESLTLES